MNIHKFSIGKIMVRVSSWSIYFHQLVFEKQERSYVVKAKSKNSVFFRKHNPLVLTRDWGDVIGRKVVEEDQSAFRSY